MSDSTSIMNGLPLASLQTIDLQKLLDNDPDEGSKLLTAAKEEGFFYLDYRQVAGNAQFLDMLKDMYAFQERLFQLSDEDKHRYDVDKLGYMKLNGYKPMGRNVGGVGNKRDGFESWAIPRNGVVGLGDEPFQRPQVMDEQLPLLAEFMRKMEIATGAINRNLSRELGLPIGQRLEDFHKPDQQAPSLLRLLKYHPQPVSERGPPQTPHTDLGSLTVLFTTQPGLQVLPRGASGWSFVEPRDGHAIINVGDGLNLMTDGDLQSCLHRVGPLPGQAMETRYSFAYLQRAEDHTRLAGPRADLKVSEIEERPEILTSGEWLHRKFSMLRAKSTRIEDNQRVLTGRTEALPV